MTNTGWKGSFKCPRCGATTWGDLKYCTDCGEALFFECEECGTAWRHFYDYHYCPACGKRVRSMSTEK